MGILLTGY